MDGHTAEPKQVITSLPPFLQVGILEVFESRECHTAPHREISSHIVAVIGLTGIRDGAPSYLGKVARGSLSLGGDLDTAQHRLGGLVRIGFLQVNGEGFLHANPTKFFHHGT